MLLMNLLFEFSIIFKITRINNESYALSLV